MRIKKTAEVCDVIIQLEEDRLAALLDNPAFASALDSGDEDIVTSLFGYDAATEEIPNSILQAYYGYDEASNTVDIPIDRVPQNAQLYDEQDTAVAFKQAAQNRGTSIDYEAETWDVNLGNRFTVQQSSTGMNAAVELARVAETIKEVGADTNGVEKIDEPSVEKGVFDFAADAFDDEDDTNSGNNTPAFSDVWASAMTTAEADTDTTPDVEKGKAQNEDTPAVNWADIWGDTQSEEEVEVSEASDVHTDFDFNVDDDDDIDLFKDAPEDHYQTAMQQYIAETRVLPEDTTWHDTELQEIIQHQLAAQSDSTTLLSMQTGCSAFDEYIAGWRAAAIADINASAATYEQLQEAIDADKLIYEMQEEHFLFVKLPPRGEDYVQSNEMLLIAEQKRQQSIEALKSDLQRTALNEDDFTVPYTDDEDSEEDNVVEAMGTAASVLDADTLQRLPDMTGDYTQLNGDEELEQQDTDDSDDAWARVWGISEEKETNTVVEHKKGVIAQFWDEVDADEDADDLATSETGEDDYSTEQAAARLWHDFDEIKEVEEQDELDSVSEDVADTLFDTTDDEPEEESEDVEAGNVDSLWDSMFEEEEAAPVDNAIDALMQVSDNIASGAVELPKTKNEAAADCVVALYKKMAMFPVLVNGALKKMKPIAQEEE